jgi:hypothetical protein
MGFIYIGVLEFRLMDFVEDLSPPPQEIIEDFTHLIVEKTLTT